MWNLLQNVEEDVAAVAELLTELAERKAIAPGQTPPS